MKTKVFYTELAYVFGIIALALGAVFMVKADFGVSMVIAPAYLVYLKLSQVWGFVTFGMAEYTLQAILLVVMVLVLRKFKVSFLFSFVTAVIYGFTLDAFMALSAPIVTVVVAWRVLFFVIGVLLCALGVAFVFQTYIAPEVYELFVKRVSAKMGVSISRFKTAYDCVSCLVAVILSFAFFGLFHFEGVKWGTVVCALVNGRLIGLYSGWMNKHLRFQDRFAMRRYFE